MKRKSFEYTTDEALSQLHNIIPMRTSDIVPLYVLSIEQDYETYLRFENTKFYDRYSNYTITQTLPIHLWFPQQIKQCESIINNSNFSQVHKQFYMRQIAPIMEKLQEFTVTDYIIIGIPEGIITELLQLTKTMESYNTSK